MISPSASEATSSTSTEELGPIVEELSAVGAGKQAGEWALTLFRDAMRVSKGGESFVYTREEIAAKAKVMLFGQSGIVLTLDGWKTGLRLDWVNAEILRRWMGEHLEAWGSTSALRSARGSILGGITSIAMGAWLGTWFLVAYGAMSLLIGLGRRLRPGRWLFIASALQALVVGIVFCVDVVVGAVSPWWGVLLIVNAIVARASFVKHRFFAMPVSGAD